MNRQNIVVVVCDTTRYAEFDPSWASDATSFERVYSSSPWTLPSHASLFTGTYSSKHGAHADNKFLDSHLTTLPEILQGSGYETVAISNNTWVSEEFGFGQGFDTFFKTWQYVQSETDLGKTAREHEGVDKLRALVAEILGGRTVTNIANAAYGQFFRKRDDNGAKRTNQWIDRWLRERDDAKPFFLFVNYLEPHLEYRPAREYARTELPPGVAFEEAMDVPQEPWRYLAGDIDMSDEEFEILEGLYRGEIRYIEERIDDLIEMLRSKGEWTDTVMFVTSDHGENIGDHEMMDHQYALYDTLLNVPLYVLGGPFERDGVDELVQLVDIPPTVLDILNVDTAGVREQFQGRSFHPSSQEPREHAIAEYMAPQPSMDALEKRVGDLPESVRKYDRSLRAVRTDRYKYIRGSEGSQELYDVRSDPEETEDIAADNEDIIAELDTKLNQWIASFEHANHTDDIQMSDDTKDRLEDLGYLQ